MKDDEQSDDQKEGEWQFAARRYRSIERKEEERFPVVNLRGLATPMCI